MNHKELNIYIIENITGISTLHKNRKSEQHNIRCGLSQHNSDHYTEGLYCRSVFAGNERTT